MNLSVAKLADRYLGQVLCYVLAGFRILKAMFVRDDTVVEARTILLIKFWGLGNIVLLLPVVRALRRTFPDSRIVFVSLERNRSLLDACAALDERIYVDDRNVLTLALSLLGATFRVGRRRPDLAIDFEQFARASALLATLGRSRQIVGLKTPGHGRDLLYHKPVPYDDGLFMGETYASLARATGVSIPVYEPESLPMTDEAVAEVTALLGASEEGTETPLVVRHPGSGDNFQGRRWPAASFAQLATLVADEFDACVVVTGTRGEVDLVAKVVGEVRAQRGRVIDAAGSLSVLGLAALVDRADALVTNDTAPVHFGSAQGTPVFAFFGPNTPRLYGPRSPGSHAFYRSDIPCSPCLTNLNYKTSRCRMPVCIRGIGVGEVRDRLFAHLRGGDASEAADVEASRSVSESVVRADRQSQGTPGTQR